MIVADPTRKPAAVAVVLVPDPDAVLLIRRAHREGDTWSGQMAFPGGRWSAGDPDLLTTARRETLEETGVDLGASSLLGRLDDFVPRSPSLPPVTVSPFVFAIDRRQPIIPNPEVAEGHWVPIDLLLSPNVHRHFDLELSGATTRFLGYHLEAGTVWGLTERILTPLIDMMEGRG
jgi:8-oxo-dGTP pyrophosphatase MutT (NUDIX family)